MSTYDYEQLKPKSPTLDQILSAPEDAQGNKIMTEKPPLPSQEQLALGGLERIMSPTREERPEEETGERR